MRVRIRGSVAEFLPTAIRTAQWLTLTTGLAVLAWPAFVLVDSAYAQWSGDQEFSRSPSTQQEEEVVVRKPQPQSNRQNPDRGHPLGKFEIPRLNLSYVLLEGTDNRTLDRSIGHVEGSALLGERGNIGIAGHRNTHFRKLEWLRRGDELVLKSRDAEYSYRVEWIRLFRPTDMEVLDAAHGPAVTLITCFPFEYVGAAPLRLIVRALPDESTKARLVRAPLAGSGE